MVTLNNGECAKAQFNKLKFVAKTKEIIVTVLFATKMLETSFSSLAFTMLYANLALNYFLVRTVHTVKRQLKTQLRFKSENE